MINLALDRETIYHLLDKARQFQVQDDECFPEMNDEFGFLAMVADYNADASYQELVTFINDLREDQQATLVALMYVGRGDFGVDEWPDAFCLAKREVGERVGEYLLEKPLVADEIARALNLLGVGSADE